jgi:hypothetical protein
VGLAQTSAALLPIGQYSIVITRITLGISTSPPIDAKQTDRVTLHFVDLAAPKG